VFSRKDLIKKEYNKIIETKLPNILQLMNHEKNNLGVNIHGVGGILGILNENSIHENFDYDDTELLSKMFSKD
jgi:hypothetical protein